MFINKFKFNIKEETSVGLGLLKSRYFYLDETGIVRANSTEPAGPNDQVVF